MTILVTGGTGFLGRHLVSRLVERGDTVRVLTRSIDVELDELGVEQLEGSLTNAEDVRRAVDGVRAVFHCAGRVERDPKHAHTMYELHVDGTRRLLDALRDQDVERIVVASTSGTVGVSTDPEFVADDDSPMAETVVKRWPYYLSKIYAERVCNRFFEEYGLPIVQMRPTLLLGPGDWRQSSTGDVVRYMKRQIPSTLSGGISFVDVRDVADAFVLAMEAGRPGATYLLGSCNLTLRDFFARLEQLTGIPAPNLPIPESAALAGARLLDSAMKLVGKRAAIDPTSVEMARHYWYIDWSRAERELGWSPRDPMLTLRDTVRWIRRNHPDFVSPTRPLPPQDMVPDETVAWTEARRED